MVRALTKLKEFVSRLRGRALEFDLKPYAEIANAVTSREPALACLTDPALREKARDLRARARAGASLDELLVDTYALVREAARRVLGLRAFDVQIIAAVALHQAKVAQMQTGEGKTLAAVFAAALNALPQSGVHVLTFNDYLARRDAQWMGGIYDFLGLSVGCVQEGMTPPERRKAYAADVTYVTAKEAGFDFLRDHLCPRPEDLVHRSLNFAIIDEADSILIDEARVPLIIAGDVAPADGHAQAMAAVVRTLRPGRDYQTDEYARNIYLTDAGVEKVEAHLGCGNLYATENFHLVAALYHALHAHAFLRRDVDYIVREWKIELVDELTGRVAERRRWPDGLHAAVAAKEGLGPPLEGAVLGSITIHHFVRLYPKRSGMTATAESSAEELWEFFGLKVAVIPPNRPCIRVDHPDVIYSDKQSKERALVGEIARVNATGQPLLVGTASVAESERLASALHTVGIACEVLNAKNDEVEAKVVAQAGALGAVTISTNMAGRGTDIRLGGADEREHDHVAQLGGLYVIGTNRHESPRIDHQLRGRSGRQGDPGSSRFFVSLEDDLIERYGIADAIPALRRLHSGSRPVFDPAATSEIGRAQRIVDGQNYEIRRTLRRYSEIVEQERQLLHRWRQETLLSSGGLGLLGVGAKKRYSDLRACFGEAVLRDVERKLTLFHIDRCWSDYLALVGHVREGLHLVTYSSLDPLNEFHRVITHAFAQMRDDIERAIIDSFLAAKITENGIDMEREGLKAPTATWTYTVTDLPLGNAYDRIAGQIGRLIKRSLGVGPRPS